MKSHTEVYLAHERQNSREFIYYCNCDDDNDDMISNLKTVDCCCCTKFSFLVLTQHFIILRIDLLNCTLLTTHTHTQSNKHARAIEMKERMN